MKRFGLVLALLVVGSSVPVFAQEAPASASASAPASAAAAAPVVAPPVAIVAPKPKAPVNPCVADPDSPGTMVCDPASDPDAARVKKYPFRNSTFIWMQSTGAVGLDKGAEPTWNPSYSWLLRLTPRYYLTEKFSLRLKLDLGVEFTNADDTTQLRQPLWEDIWFDAVYAKAYTNKLTKVSVTPSLRFILPASRASQARSLYVGVSPGFLLFRDFKIKGHALDFSYGFRYTKNLNHYTTLQYDAPTIGSCAGGSGTGDCGQFLHSGARNASQVFTNILMADLEITKKLKTSVMVAFFNSLLYDTTTGTVPLAGGGTTTVGTDPVNSVNHRASVWYMAEVAYDIHPTISVGLAVSTFNPQLTEDSHYRAPFINRYTEFVLSTTISLDQVVANIDRRVRGGRAHTQVARAE